VQVTGADATVVEPTLPEPELVRPKPGYPFDTDRLLPLSYTVYP
jgi:hypothetical protein